MDNTTKRNLRYTVSAAVTFWPGRLPAIKTRHDAIRHAFWMIRDNMRVGDTFRAAIGRTEIAAIRAGMDVPNGR